jgi:hypothetical protein
MFQARDFHRAILAAALTLAGSTALAAGQNPVVVKMNGTSMLVGTTMRRLAQPSKHEPRLIKIFDNMLPVKKYPYGTYFCCLGPSVDGPDNTYGVPEQWWAEAFTPTADATVTRIEIGVGYSTGTNRINIGIYNDSNGLPGTALVSQDVTNLPTFGSCCATVNLKYGRGIQVTAGTQYWVVLSTDSTDMDFLGGWNDNTPDQVTRVNQAENFGSGWISDDIAPGVALAVWGK